MEEATTNRVLQNGDAYDEENPVDMFGVFKQGFARLSESLFGWGSKPPMRKSKSADHALEDDGQMGEGFEMAHFHRQHSELKTKGHDFVLQHLSNPTWCDECGDFIWGLYKQCLRCRNCHFTCHQNCGALVRLGCKSKSSPDLAGQTEPPLLEPTDTLQTVSSDGSSEPTNEKDETDSGYRSGTIPEEKLPRKPSQATLNREELKLKIEEYNLMVPGAEFSLKILSARHTTHSILYNNQLEDIYHVIYKPVESISDSKAAEEFGDECPLLTSLEWDPDKLSYIRLVLQENETGDIMWDAFSQPELSNFLIVLDREEKEYCSQLEYKYKVMRKIIQSRLKELRKEKLAEKRKSLGLVS
ncbi:RASSF1 [Mytilus edulis]|uniref:RASSF1 n=1 Tax=Mytilus edulis TaxID=6550 RepID=A0A8S3S8J5_MYTED|nr:RASSF1 [Mytilus edulis]